MATQTATVKKLGKKWTMVPNTSATTGDDVDVLTGVSGKVALVDLFKVTIDAVPTAAIVISLRSGGVEIASAAFNTANVAKDSDGFAGPEIIGIPGGDLDYLITNTGATALKVQLNGRVESLNDIG